MSLQILAILAIMAVMATVATPKLRVLQAASLRRVPWLLHGFSTRNHGTSKFYGGKSLNLGFTKEDRRESVERNRKLFLQAAGAADRRKAWPLISLRQIHSDVIHIVKSPKPARLVGDGLITILPRVALAVLTADCFPVLLVDTRNKAVGAFHAGWRGTVQRIAEKGVGAMRREYGTRPEDIQAAIGPGIHKCCYAVGEEVRSQFESQFDYAGQLFQEQYSPDPIREKYPLLFLNARPPGHGDSATKMYLDIMEANRRQLLKAGVPEEQISMLDQCTSCDTRNFFSHRAERGKTGRMMALIGIKN